MRRVMLGGLVITGFLGMSLLGAAPRAQASKPWDKVTKMACAKCHTSEDKKDMSDKDLSKCGKEANEVLKRGNYKRGKTEADQKVWGEKLLKGFKCSG